MEKENAPKKEEMLDKEVPQDNETSQQNSSTEDEHSNKKGADLNKTRKGHVTDLGKKIKETESRIEDMNKSIMGHGIFDY